MRQRIDNTPYFLAAKFAGTCAETGQSFKKGDNILYYPGTRKAYCKDSKTYKDFQTAEFDRTVLGHEY